MTQNKKHDDLKDRLEKLAWISDSSIALPGKYRIGLDSIIGLFPVIGDLISALMSLYIVFIGLRAKVPKLVIAAVSFNILVDTTIGAIPILGDIFDMVFKSNERNVKLLNRYIQKPEKTHLFLKIVFALFLTFLLVVIVLILWLVTQAIRWLIAFI